MYESDYNNNNSNKRTAAYSYIIIQYQFENLCFDYWTFKQSVKIQISFIHVWSVDFDTFFECLHLFAKIKKKIILEHLHFCCKSIKIINITWINVNIWISTVSNAY